MPQDVVELILADHRRFEELFREIRNSESDQLGALRELSDLLVAHAMAEETEVYPVLRKLGVMEDDDFDHNSDEHTESDEELLGLLDLDGPGDPEWLARLGFLAEAVNRHLNGEESMLLNDMRALSPAQRHELGEAFLRTRRTKLDEGCGHVDQVRLLVDHDET